jgi:hypothetical protein
MAHIVSSSTAMYFVTNMRKKCKRTLPSASEVTKNEQKIISSKQKFEILSRLKKVNKLLIYTITLDLFIVVHIKVVTMLTEFKKVLRQELQYSYSKITIVLLQ